MDFSLILTQQTNGVLLNNNYTQVTKMETNDKCQICQHKNLIIYKGSL